MHTFKEKISNWDIWLVLGVIIFSGVVLATVFYLPAESTKIDYIPPPPAEAAAEVIRDIEPKELLLVKSAPVEKPVTNIIVEPRGSEVLIEEKFYSVVKVIDGDTIVIDLDGVNETLRLIGMDTPETVDPRKPVQCFGLEASNKAKEILNGQKVSLEADPTQGERDKYHRLLRYIFLADGTNYQDYMIRQGYAHEYTYNLSYKYQTQFKQAQGEARVEKRGLWANGVCENLP